MIGDFLKISHFDLRNVRSSEIALIKNDCYRLNKFEQPLEKLNTYWEQYISEEIFMPENHPDEMHQFQFSNISS